MRARRPAKLSLACLPTPFYKLARTSEQLGVNVWIKRDDLTGNAEGGNKIRKLEYALADAIDQGADTIITSGGVQSNHCRATARLSRPVGCVRDRDPGAGEPPHHRHAPAASPRRAHR